MKKIFIIFISIILLSGCTPISLDENLNQLIDSLLNKEINYRLANHNKEFYSYYLEPNVDTYSSSQISHSISFDNINAIFTLNIHSFIEDNNIIEPNIIYNSNFIKIYTYKTTYIDHSNEVTPINIELYEYLDDIFLLILTPHFNIQAQLSLSQFELTLTRLINHMKFINLYNQNIIDKYSNISEINAEKQQLSLYESIAPSNGPLSEIIKEKK